MNESIVLMLMVVPITLANGVLLCNLAYCCVSVSKDGFVEKLVPTCLDLYSIQCPKRTQIGGQNQFAVQGSEC